MPLNNLRINLITLLNLYKLSITSTNCDFDMILNDLLDNHKIKIENILIKGLKEIKINKYTISLNIDKKTIDVWKIENGNIIIDKFDISINSSLFYIIYESI